MTYEMEPLEILSDFKSSESVSSESDNAAELNAAAAAAAAARLSGTVSSSEEEERSAKIVSVN